MWVKPRVLSVHVLKWSSRRPISLKRKTSRKPKMRSHEAGGVLVRFFYRMGSFKPRSRSLCLWIIYRGQSLSRVVNVRTMCPFHYLAKGQISCFSSPHFPGKNGRRSLPRRGHMLPRVKRTGTSSLALALSRSEFLSNRDKRCDLAIPYCLSLPLPTTKTGASGFTHSPTMWEVRADSEFIHGPVKTERSEGRCNWAIATEYVDSLKTSTSALAFPSSYSMK